MDRSSKQNVNKIIAALNNTLDQMDIYILLFIPKWKVHIVFKYTWNIFKDTPRDRTQNKP